LRQLLFRGAGEPGYIRCLGGKREFHCWSLRHGRHRQNVSFVGCCFMLFVSCLTGKSSARHLVANSDNLSKPLRPRKLPEG
jgi:hypothetical protein